MYIFIQKQHKNYTQTENWFSYRKVVLCFIISVCRWETRNTSRAPFNVRSLANMCSKVAEVISKPNDDRQWNNCGLFKENVVVFFIVDNADAFWLILFFLWNWFSNKVFFSLNFCSYDGTTRRRRERSKRSHHRHANNSPESERKTRRHRHHREEYNTRNKHRERVKEKEEAARTPVKVKQFFIGVGNRVCFIILFLKIFLLDNENSFY